VSLKGGAQQVLRQVGLYERLRASFVYDAYWSIANRGLLEDRRQEVAFYRALLDGLPRDALIFDVGANHGRKTDVFLRLGARVVAVEPDDFNGRVLRQKFLALRLRPKPVTIVKKAVSDRETVERMWIDAPGSAKNTLSQKWVSTLRNDETRFGTRLEFQGQKEVQTTTLDQLIAAYGKPYFVKIDVEGFEPNVLRGLSQRVPCVSFEINLPEFRDEGTECIALLKQLAGDGEFNFTPDMRSGLALDRWLHADAFLETFDRCPESSIEVFWRCVEHVRSEASQSDARHRMSGT
jgi:FkbM family methyltransferase